VTQVLDLAGFAEKGPEHWTARMTRRLDSISVLPKARAVSPETGRTITLDFIPTKHGRTEEALVHYEAYLRRASTRFRTRITCGGHELRRAGRIEEAIEEVRTERTTWNAYYRADTSLGVMMAPPSQPESAGMCY